MNNLTAREKEIMPLILEGKSAREIAKECYRTEAAIKARKSNKVQIGSTVEVKNGKVTTYHIVGPVEADPLSGKISNESPLGLALIGKEVGEKATISTPKGDTTYTIVSIA